MSNLKNNMPYPDGLDLSKDSINGAGEHLHDLYSSSGENIQQLYQSKDDLTLTGGYNFGGSFMDLNNFDIEKWGKFLNPDFADYL